jgi:hypothetical protein
VKRVTVLGFVGCLLVSSTALAQSPAAAAPPDERVRSGFMARPGIGLGLTTGLPEEGDGSTEFGPQV